MADETAAVPDASPVPESERRWDDFRGGREIELPGGETWTFFEPAAVMRDGKAGWTFDAPPDIDAILSHRFAKILAKWRRAADENERACVILEAAWFLLARQYNVSRSEFEGILSGMSGWDESRQAALMGGLIFLVGTALARAAGLAETGAA